MENINENMIINYWKTIIEG